MSLVGRIDRTLGGCLLKVIGLVFLTGAAFALWAAGGDLYEWWRARSWPATPGTIVSSRLSGRAAEVRYAYQASGRKLTARRVHIGEFSGIESYARAVVARYPAGSSAAVYYDPKRPERAVLERPVPWVYVLLLAMGLVLLWAARTCFRAKKGIVEMVAEAAGHS
jgi:hypothetical protein